MWVPHPSCWGGTEERPLRGLLGASLSPSPSLQSLSRGPGCWVTVSQSPLWETLGQISLNEPRPGAEGAAQTIAQLNWKNKLG